MIKLAFNKNLFLIFHQISKFSEQSLKLNSYLKQRLAARKFLPLKDFQLEALQVVSNQKNNCFINSCTGSGKTLAYLIPILNKILNQKDELIKAKKFIQESSFEYQKNQRHGALIFTLNKQLALQIYKQIRLLDTQNRLNVYRVGPISHFAPVVQLLNKKQKTLEEENQIADNVENNIAKCINWVKTDILIATPQMFFNFMTQMAHNKSNLINPRFIVIDQADLLLQIDQNLAQYTHKIISLIRNQKGGKKSLRNTINFFSQQQNRKEQNIQYLMSSSSFPKKINKIPLEEYLKHNFEPIKTVAGVNKHRLPERVTLNYIQIQSKSSLENQNEQNLQIENQKLYYLAKILADPEKKGNRFIIFCNNKKTVDKISNFVSQKLKLSSIQYYAGLPSDQRSYNLYKFMNQSIDILISTDLGSRGLDFTKPIHTVIEYNMSQNIVNFINRAGRTARNQLPGEVISFVEEKNKIFFQHLAQKNSHDQQFDDLFSRKRSYNKLFLKYMKQQSI